jgi:hypothetical protein
VVRHRHRCVALQQTGAAMTIEPGTLCRIVRCPEYPDMVGLFVTTRDWPQVRPLVDRGVITPAYSVTITAPWLLQGMPSAIELDRIEPVVGTRARAEINAECAAAPMPRWPGVRAKPPMQRRYPDGWPWKDDDCTRGRRD